MDVKLKVGALVVVILGVATVFKLQQGTIKRLVAENADLSTRLTQMASLQDTNELLAAQLEQAVGTSQANLRESARLRGQGVRLRQLEQENTQLKAQRQQLELKALESQSASEDYAFAPRVAARLQTVKTAVVDYYAKNGSLPGITDFIEPTLIGEGLLKESTPDSSNVRTRIVELADAPVTGANQAYSLDGSGTNVIFGRLVVESVVGNVTAKRASELSQLIDGPGLSSPVGETDLTGRVKFDAIPLDGTGEVHIYITHR